MNPVKDFLGREIKPGDTVVYPVRRGSAMWLKKLRIQQVESDPKPCVSGYNDLGRRIAIFNVETCVVIDAI